MEVDGTEVDGTEMNKLGNALAELSGSASADAHAALERHRELWTEHKTGHCQSAVEQHELHGEAV